MDFIAPDFTNLRTYPDKTTGKESSSLGSVDPWS